MKKSLTVLIPAYNEEQYIERTVKETISYLNKLKILSSYEIIICANGCIDKTVEIARKLSKKYKQVSYLECEKGAGNAIRAGIKKAKKEVVTWVFADGEMDYTFLDRGVALMGDYDFINSRRETEKGGFGVDDTSVRGSKSNYARRFLSYSCRAFAKIWIPLPITEIGVVKMFWSKWAKNKKLKAKNWDIQSDLLMNAGLDKLKMVEIPIRIRIRRHTAVSRLNIFKETRSLFMSIFGTGLKLRLKGARRI